MKEMDCVEVTVEKERYAKDGVHKGMQGWICQSERVNGFWLVNFPRYGAEADIAEISVLETDLKPLPNGMNPKLSEQIHNFYEQQKSTRGETE